MSDAARRDLLVGDWLSWNPASLPPSRWNAFVPLFAWVFDVVEPALTVELGCGTGESFRPLCELAGRVATPRRIVGVDCRRREVARAWEGDGVDDALAEY